MKKSGAKNFCKFGAGMFGRLWCRAKKSLILFSKEKRHFKEYQSVNLQLLTVNEENICVLQNMLELYQYELSDIWPQELDKFGRYGYGLDEYLSGRDQGYLITSGDCIAGFSMVSSESPFGECNWIEQFFILKSMRRQNLGLTLAEHSIGRRQGAWKVGVMTENANAYKFWKTALASIVGLDKVTETIIRDGWWQGTVFSFDR